MSLIKCPECGNEFSDKASACPKCGFPIDEITRIKKEQIIREHTEGEICKECGCNQIDCIENVNGVLLFLCHKCSVIQERIPLSEDMREKPTGLIECPYCHSTNTKKISSTSRAASFLTLGLMSKKVGKQWHCNKCGSNF